MRFAPYAADSKPVHWMADVNSMKDSSKMPMLVFRFATDKFLCMLTPLSLSTPLSFMEFLKLYRLP